MVALQDLGSMGAAEGDPQVVHWQWYHFLPGLHVWIFLGVLGILWARSDPSKRVFFAIGIGLLIVWQVF